MFCCIYWLHSKDPHCNLDCVVNGVVVAGGRRWWAELLCMHWWYIIYININHLGSILNYIILYYIILYYSFRLVAYIVTYTVYTVQVIFIILTSLLFNYQSINQSLIHSFISNAGGRWKYYLTVLRRK